MELEHFDKQSCTTGKNLLFFLLQTLKNCILNEKFNPQMTTIIFPKTSALFFNFWKRAIFEKRPAPLVTRLRLLMEASCSSTLFLLNI